MSLLPSPLKAFASRQVDASQQALRELLDRHPRWFVLTGAGCSTESGIPDYRDGQGQWKRTPPVTYQAFVGEPLERGLEVLLASLVRRGVEQSGSSSGS